jgi:hypothetical protein
MKKLLVGVFLLIAPAAVAQRDPADYMRLLLPILRQGAGASGAFWSYAIALRNDGPQPLDAFPLSADCFCCAQCLRIREYPALQADQDGFGTFGEFPGSFHTPIAGFPGTFLYVDRARAGQLSAHLEVGDSSRTPAHFTTVPIVRETEFVTGRHSIVGVPTLPTSRITVRAYQLDPNAGAGVAIRVFGFGPYVIGPYMFAPGFLLAGTVLEFQYDRSYDGCPPPITCPAVPYHPGYAEISNLAATMPEVATNPSISKQIRIEFEPADPKALYWPMVTLTDNVTNEVQIFTMR